MTSKETGSMIHNIIYHLKLEIDQSDSQKMTQIKPGRAPPDLHQNIN
jgi:hypothetical protein